MNKHLFEVVDKNLFLKSVDNLISNIPNYSEGEIFADLLKLVALPKDGHTLILTKQLNFHFFPIIVHFFSDGVYVISAGEEYKKPDWQSDC